MSQIVTYNIECGNKKHRVASLNATSAAVTTKLGSWSLNRVDFDLSRPIPKPMFPENAERLS